MVGGGWWVVGGVDSGWRTGCARMAVRARTKVRAVRAAGGGRAAACFACGWRVEAARVGHQRRLGHAHQHRALHRALRCVSVAHAQRSGCVGVGLDDVHCRR